MVYRLPDEVLLEIMAATEPIDIHEKFSLACVSRRWRGIAIFSQVHWASFFVSTTEEAGALPTVLARSGGAPLHVALEYIPGYSSDWSLALRHIEPDLLRVRHLNITFRRVPIPDFLTSGQSFPMLEHLLIDSISGGTFAPLSFHAPILRTLSLSRLGLIGSWEQILSPSLETLRILEDDGFVRLSALWRIIHRCPRLLELSFVNIGVSVEEDGAVEQALGPLAHTLQQRQPPIHSLHLNLWEGDYASARVLSMLNRAGVRPHLVSVHARDFDDVRKMQSLVSELCRNIPAVSDIAFNPTDGRSFAINAPNCQRTVLLMDRPVFDYSRLLSCLATLVHAPHSLSIPVGSWKQLIDGRLQWPAAIDELRVAADGDAARAMDDLLDSVGGDPRPFVCKDVSRVVVDIQRNTAYDYYDSLDFYPNVKRSVMTIAQCVKRATCGAVPIELCIGGTRLAEREVDHARELKLLGDELASLEQDSWVLCAHCRAQL